MRNMFVCQTMNMSVGRIITKLFCKLYHEKFCNFSVNQSWASLFIKSWKSLSKILNKTVSQIINKSVGKIFDKSAGKILNKSEGKFYTGL